MSIKDQGLQAKTLSALVEASAAINSSLDLPRTLQSIARMAASVMQAEASSVLLLDRERNKLIFTAAVGDRADVLIGEEFNADLGIAGKVARTAEAVLVILQRMHDPSGTSAFVTSLPVAGIDGTLSGRMRDTPAAGNVRAKTGTMSNIRSMAGYVRTRDGETLAFVAMVNNFEGAGAAANQALDTIAISLASFSRRGVRLQPDPATGRSK